MQFIDLKTQYTTLKSDIDTAIQTVLDDARFILGREVGEFEMTSRRSRQNCSHSSA